MSSKDLHVIVGLGATGFSCARYLSQRGFSIAINDTRAKPPQLEDVKRQFPDVPISLGGFDDALLDKAAVLIVSPGIALQEPSIARQISRGIPVIGDIELFAKDAKAPIIAITGTNAKSTVTTLVGKMMENAGVKVQVGGNLGIPALDLLTTPRPELFVLELSSFQLETTYSLAPQVATVLNVTPDHMDRYGNLDDYWTAKQRVYANCKTAVCNRDDARTNCDEPQLQKKLFFTLNEPRENEFGLLTKKGEAYLAFQDQALMPVQDLPILGKHYQANALASLAIGYGYGLAMEPMLQTLLEFKGLPHRCELVRVKGGVRWYNDSKGTNVGAALAAIEGLGSVIEGKLVLIAGGVGKNADFAPLVPSIEKYAKAVVLIGEAASILDEVIGGRVNTCLAKSMEEAIQIADQLAKAGDSVLLSPACASFDMFNNFEHRGNVFAEEVRGL